MMQITTSSNTKTHGVCPSCGRCRECGQPAPQPVVIPPQPAAPMVPWNPMNPVP